MSRAMDRMHYRVVDLGPPTAEERMPTAMTVKQRTGDGVSAAGGDRLDRREAARRAYRDSIAAGKPLTGREIADRFGYSRSWGRDRISEVRTESTHSPIAKHATGEGNERTSASRDPSARISVPTQEGFARSDAQQARAPAMRRVAWAAFIVGTAASVAANVMHAQIVSTSRAAWIGAAFWPIALLLAIEVLARVQWLDSSRWYALARYAGTSMVATVAAVLSYRHMAGLLLTWGEDNLSAYLGPLAVDGLMILAAAALLVDHHGKSDGGVGLTRSRGLASLCAGR